MCAKLAAVFYKNYLRNNKKDLQEEVSNELYRCEFSRKLTFLEQKAYVENFGDRVNSRYNEVNPVQSPNFQNRFYFSELFLELLLPLFLFMWPDRLPQICLSPTVHEI